MAPAAAAEAARQSAEEQKRVFVSEHAALRTSVRMLPAERSLADLWATSLLHPPAGAVLALDFDQTITLVRGDGGGVRRKTLRGGEAAREALFAMAAAGVRMVVVTAQTPSIATVENMAKEMAELGIAELFDVQPADRGRAEAWLRQTYAPPEALAVPLGRACTRLMLLLLLLTERKVADLCRIGFSNMSLGEAAVSYRLEKVGQGWSGEQRLNANDDDPALCPVRAWRAYVELSASFRGEGGADRLLIAAAAAASPTGLSPTSETAPPSAALGAEAALQLVRGALTEAGYSPRDSAWLAEPHAVETDLGGGVKIAAKGHTVAARYNKPEGLQAWLRRENLRPSSLVFVDDNSDNTFSMFLSFAQLEKEQTAAAAAAAAADSAAAAASTAADTPPPPPDVCSVWYPPETSNFEENYDAQTRELLLALCRGPVGDA